MLKEGDLVTARFREGKKMAIILQVLQAESSWPACLNPGGISYKVYAFFESGERSWSGALCTPVHELRAMDLEKVC